MTTKNVDTLVIGGGIAGTGIAYYLAERGITDILLVEAASDFGAGATAGSFGNVRQQFGTPLEIECSRRGLAFWKTAEERFDSPCPFHEDGYMLTTGNEETAAVLREQAEVQRAEGMPNVHILPPDEIEKVAPFINAEGLILGSYTPEDGHVTPQDGVTAYIRGGRRLGVRYERGWPVSSITRENGRWRVEGRDVVIARQVVVAAGAGTRDLLRPFGLDLDMHTVKHVSAITEPAFPDRTVPTVIDLDLNGMCVEREGAGLAVAMLGRNPAPQSYIELVEMFSEAAAVRAPSLTELEVVSELIAWPILGGDGMPLVGEVEEDLWGLAFTGHGVMHGPPVAEALADTMIGKPDDTLDMSEWSIRREPGEHTVLWRANASN